MRRSPILFVGGCHRDVVARPSGVFEPGTSCPGSVRETFGGVARNVAVLVASAGLPTALVSRIGDDPAGRSILSALRAAGVDDALVTVDADATTGTYVAVHDQAGELVAAVSDLSVYDRISSDALVPAMEAIRAAPLVFADANLPAATLAAVAKAAGPRLLIDAISRAKAVRILPAVGQGALGFVNLAAAAALLGREPSSPADAARSLGAAGFTRIVVTGGPRPLAILDHGVVRTIDVPPVDVVDVTGAGDALTAGTIVGLDRGLDLPAAVAIGIAAAGAALRSTGALDRLPPDVLQRLPAPRPSTGAQP